MREITDKQILLSPDVPVLADLKDRFDRLIQELGPDSGSDCYLWEGLVKNALFIFTLRNASYGPGSPIHLASGQFRNHKSVKQL